MNIVIFTDTYLPKIDGVGISVDNFSRLLSQKGHQFVICAPKYEDEESVETPEGVQIIRFKNAPLPSYPEIKVVLPSHKRLNKAMHAFGEGQKPDLIHIETPGLLGQYGVFASKMYNVPMLGTYHTLVSEQDTYISLYRLLKVDTLLGYFKANKKIKKNLEKVERKDTSGFKKRLIMQLTNKLYDQCSIVVSPSFLIKEELMATGLRAPVEVVSNGMDLTRFKGDAKAQPQDPPKFLHVGRISYEKNCDVVLKAFSLIQEQIPGATLDIIGDGPAVPSLKVEANQLDLQDHITFHGYVPHKELHTRYPQYDCFLTASTMETQGLVVLEAMACGLPCVGVDKFALPELIQDDRNGFIVEPYDHVAMAKKALEMVQDNNLFRRFSEQSLAIAQEHELNRCAERMETVYKMVLQGEF